MVECTLDGKQTHVPCCGILGTARRYPALLETKETKKAKVKAKWKDIKKGLTPISIKITLCRLVILYSQITVSLKGVRLRVRCKVGIRTTSHMLRYDHFDAILPGGC